MDICSLTALELGEKIRSGELTPTDAVNGVIAAAEKKDKIYNCYTSLEKEQAYKLAKEVEKQIKDGKVLSSLAGVPVAVKDNICEKGKLTTCASKMLDGFRPPYDATVITKIKKAGMIPLGKLNMDEFAMGSSTESSVIGCSKNPWNTDCVAGGSSGGAAAAVKSGEGIIALATDTGGSIRQPCSFCGVTGLKPTYGAVSRYGLIAFASSLDTVGTVAKNARDTAALYSIISGKDDKDLTSKDTEKFSLSELENRSLKGVKIGIPKELLGGIGTDTARCIESAVATLKALGADVNEISMPILNYTVSAYYIIACAEASSNHARYDGVRYGHRTFRASSLEEMYINSRSEGFGTEVKKRIMLGNFVLSEGFYDAYYGKALKVNGLISESFEEAFKSFDYLLAPVSSGTAYKTGECSNRSLGVYKEDIYTACVNLAGLPSLALPCGFSEGGMPIGMQLIGKAFDERGLLSVGVAFQSVTDYHAKTPEELI